MSSRNSPNVERLSWGWLLGCFGVGSALIGFAFFADGTLKWPSIATETSVNVGTAVMLAGLLFLLERRFTASVNAKVERVQAVVNERIDRQEARTKTSLDELRGQVESKRDQRNSELDDAVAEIATDVSHASVAGALGRAVAAGAVPSAGVMVPVTTNPIGLTATFYYGPARNVQRGDVGSAEPQLLVTINVTKRHGERGTPVISTVWLPTDSAADVADRLTVDLERRGRWAGPGTMDWTTAVSNLHAALTIAVGTRRGIPGNPELAGSLSQYIDGNWFLTDAGFENPSHQFILRRTDFPSALEAMASARDDEASDWNPVRPDWADETVWNWILLEGRSRFRRLMDF